ncbi:hypothetical protein DTO002I6_3251 [Penicillium roqueforti]|nr:hypothetical protein DTO002I6_3251 [Penicillium roqueforti]
MASSPQDRRPLIISGPSGAGKGTLIQKLIDTHPHTFELTVSHTTRQPRPGEKDGISYHFVSVETYNTLKHNGDLIEDAMYTGAFYGTSKAALAEILDKGLIPILDIEMTGVQQVKTSGFDARYVFVKPRDLDLDARGPLQPSREFLYEWDCMGGELTPAIAGQDSSVALCQRSTSESAFPTLKDAYGHQLPFHPGLDPHASRLNRVHQQDPLDYGQAYTNDHFNPRTPPTGYQQLINHQVDNGIYPGAGTVTDGKASSPPEWSPGMQYKVARDTTGRRTGSASISDRSDVTSSSRSDVSIPEIHIEDLQGLSLGDHPASHMVLPYEASSHSHCNDSIPGDVQRKRHDRKVQKSSEPAYVIPGRSSEHDTLDPRYKRQSDPRRFFRVGRVFSMLWHENAGWHGTIVSEKLPSSSSPFTRGKYQEPIYSSIRRMVVVKEQKGCCWCVPITTYSGQGVAKAGVDRSKHAVIHMRGDRPRTVKFEPRMAKEPLEVDPARPDQKLDCMSRVNFGKVYTVEHNVKVLPVGKITEASRARFLEYAQGEFIN